MKLTIYDLDGTLLARATFTPFLLFAATRLAPWRLVLAPLWVVLLVAHKAGLVGRTALKHSGMRLLVGRPSPARLDKVAAAFAVTRMADLQPGARAALERDRREGRTVVIATAAYAFYARHIADALSVEHLVASAWQEQGLNQPNCYGPQKLAQVEAWLAQEGHGTEPLRFYSDSFADAPLLDRAEEAFFVTRNPRKAARARARGWQAVDFSR
ncbi:HAD family hydrolase [Croceibacterium ferulae]|uniref:HAD family hydrolase n=1 Tax=Croceibacterium ferulae TaxID=1854641 RepID=UPI000EAF6DA5|nr:haloacid dehalogenase-like hydrolase [Croceibacterium ferulae]